MDSIRSQRGLYFQQPETSSVPGNGRSPAPTDSPHQQLGVTVSAGAIFDPRERHAFEQFLDELATDNQHLFNPRIPAPLFSTTAPEAFGEVKREGLHFGSDPGFNTQHAYQAHSRHLLQEPWLNTVASEIKAAAAAGKTSTPGTARPVDSSHPQHYPQQVGHHAVQTDGRPQFGGPPGPPASHDRSRDNATGASNGQKTTKQSVKRKASSNNVAERPSKQPSNKPDQSNPPPPSWAPHSGSGGSLPNQGYISRAGDRPPMYPGPQSPNPPTPVSTTASVPAKSTTLHRKRASKVDRQPPTPSGRLSGTPLKSTATTTNVEGDGGSSKKPLTTDQKRQNHISSEQKRRDQIKEGFADLANRVPKLRGTQESKSTMLAEAIDYIRLVRAGNDALRAQIRQLKRR
ncbi:hypothetical protein PYCC9005_004304 [Savitreella phatthalungensis]